MVFLNKENKNREEKKTHILSEIRYWVNCNNKIEEIHS